MSDTITRQATVKCHDAFKPLYTATSDGIDLIIAIGGRGGMKTYEVSKFAAFDATVRKRRNAVLRDEASTIRESILNEILSRFDTANRSGFFDTEFEKLDTGIKNRVSGNMQVFTRGFRASSNQKKANLKGMSEVDTAIVEEAEDIRSFEKFSTFKDTIRTEKRLIIVILNTPDIQHWIVKRYFNLEMVTEVTLPDGRVEKIDGYWKLIPKKIEGFRCIQTNYTDNQWLPANIIRDYQNYGCIEHPSYDLHYYLTAILGLASSGRKGQVITKARAIKLADYLKLPYKEVFGLDFGTSSPAGIVGCKMHEDTIWARQLLYKPTPTKQIGIFLCEHEFDDGDLIIADSADPISISKLRNGFPPEELTQQERELYPRLLTGFEMRSAVKGPGSVTAGIGLLNSMKQFIVEESTDFWNEVYNYIYAENKSGEFTNEPIDDFNHLIDPWRYVAESRGRYF